MSDRSPWRIHLAPKAAKTLQGLGRTDRKRLQDAIKALPAGDVVRVQGQPATRFRLRVGDWRVIFTIDAAQQTIVVSLIRPRGDAYRP